MNRSVTSSLTPRAAAFIDSVSCLRPQLAVFDCDGTLWAGDSGEGFFDWELKRGVVSDEIARWARARYTDYKAGNVDEDTMCGEMVTMHRGLAETDLERVAAEFFEQTFLGNIFPEMWTLVKRLQESGCDVWAVSSTNEWVVRAGMKHFGIPASRVLAAAAQIENGEITDRLVRVPSGDGKRRAIQEVVGQVPDAAFGNSRWDAEMLALARHGFAVNPNADLKKTAEERGWTVYWPEGAVAPRGIPGIA